MKDQNTILDNETYDEKWNRGLDLYIESVHKPDHALREIGRASCRERV